MTMTDPAQVRVLLFDLGGVLIEIDPERSFAHWALAAGSEPATMRSRFQSGDSHHRLERGEITEAAWFDTLRAQLGVDLDRQALAEGWNALLGDVIPGVPEQLGRATAALPTYLFSNTDRSHHRVWSGRHARLFDRFSGLFISCELGRRKPEPQAFLDVAQAIGCRPANILFFDDVVENVEAARMVGLQALRVRETADIGRALDALGLPPAQVHEQ